MGVHFVVFSICSYQIGPMNFKSVALVRFVTKYFCTEKGNVPNMMSQSFKGKTGLFSWLTEIFQ